MVLCPSKNKPAEVPTKRGNAKRRIGGRSETSHASAHTPVFIVVLVCQVVHMFTDSLHFSFAGLRYASVHIEASNREVSGKVA
jgi:hypothetical protein